MEKTKEYLKMADVTFGEPVTENNGCIFSRDFVAGFHFKSTKHPLKAAHYVSHAINSHDELVNQRNELLKALKVTKMVPDGWQLVPVNPTTEMVQAITHNPVPLGTKGVYQAMLAAAPKYEGGAA